jgi:hypothetical protein
MKIIIIIVITLFLSACVSLTSTHEISGHIGCAPTDITASNYQTTDDIQTFRAVCHNVTYYCTTRWYEDNKYISCKKSILHTLSARK